MAMTVAPERRLRTQIPRLLPRSWRGIRVNAAMDFISLLQLMVNRKASDLFITTGVPPSLKINGRISAVSPNRLTAEQARDVVYHIMAPSQRAEFDRYHEANFAINQPDIGRFRVNVFRQQNQVGMVLRRIKTEVPTFDDLHLPPVLRDLAMLRQGLVILVGGAGVGKSSSLAAMIHHRNHHSNGHIICIEDPIEYIHQPAGCIITQREVGVDTESFEAALKNTLRQAPDAVMIGEIRSRETMEHAIQFAETGHLCLATLHAANADQALDRIINFFPEDRRPQLLMDLALNLKAAVAQRLVPRADGNGARPVVEILLSTPLVAKYIRTGDHHRIKEVMKKSENLGMKTFDRALYELYCAGEVSYDDALAAADSSNELRLTIKLGTQEVADDSAFQEPNISVFDSDR